MAIFKRIADILRANINDLIDKAEDPEKMVKQIILDMQRELQNATQALGKAMASERMAQKQYDTALKASQDWEAKAKAALACGDQEAAKTALAKKVKYDADAAEFKEMLDTISTQTEAIRDQVELLKSKLEEAKSREAMLIARSKMADTQKSLAESLGGLDASSSMAKFDKMEEKIARKEAEADAFSELNGTKPVEGEVDFEKYETEAKVNSELERLMAEMGTTPTSAE
ncbi:MAG: PspA/IM30 family protein [Oscillospiraceae bacterium]|nr:PspA/IM30 family protein [Oscillospiraceae bacterium]